MKAEFLDPAEIEFIDAIRYDNSESERLGYEFAGEVNRTIALMIEYPNAWAEFEVLDSHYSGTT
jgi:hypothetical protein